MDSADDLEREGREAAADPERRYEAFRRLRKALALDPLRRGLLPLLRTLASDDAERADVERLAARPATFRAAVPGAFAYPLRGGGAVLLLLGAAAAAVARALFVDPLLDVSASVFRFNVGTLAALFGLGAAIVSVAAWYLDIVTATVNGSDDLPDWRDVQRGGFAVDAAKVTNAFLAAYLPLWAGSATALASASLVLGTLALPMGLLVNAATGQPLACFNPFFVARSAWRIRGDYLTAVGAGLGAAAAVALLEFVARGLLPSRGVGSRPRHWSSTARRSSCAWPACSTGRTARVSGSDGTFQGRPVRDGA